MYNDNCKQEGCSVPGTVDSMKNVILEIHDHAMKAREMAFDIYKKNCLAHCQVVRRMGQR